MKCWKREVIASCSGLFTDANRLSQSIDSEGVGWHKASQSIFSMLIHRANNLTLKTILSKRWSQPSLAKWHTLGLRLTPVYIERDLAPGPRAYIITWPSEPGTRMCSRDVLVCLFCQKIDAAPASNCKLDPCKDLLPALALSEGI